MAVSGSIGGVNFSTQLVIDHAFRMVRLAPQQISGEYIQTATEQLGLMLSAWANEGTPLWCQTKYILPLQEGVLSLDISATFPGVIDVLEANLRNCQRFSGVYTSTSGQASLAFDSNIETACTEVAPAGNITLQMTTAAPLENFGLMANVTGVWDVSLQYSSDGITWITFYTNAALTVKAKIFTWLDFEGLPNRTYWRLQANNATVLNVAELFFGNTAQEIPVARINKDDYWNLPNKTFKGRPVQYWCDRQVNGPVMKLWPSPGGQFVFNQITILSHRHIMDVGTMAQTIEVPQRTFDAVIASLAERLRLVILEVDKEATADIPSVAKQARVLFWGEERDDSPINLSVDISAYTR